LCRHVIKHHTLWEYFFHCSCHKHLWQ
jgi:hypothetical protein